MDILLDAAGARHMVMYLRPGWKSEEEIGGQWHGWLNIPDPIRDPGWMCVEYVRTGMSKEDTVMRVMFDTIREDKIILHLVAVRMGQRASGGQRRVSEVQHLQVCGASHGLEGPPGVDQGLGRELYDAVGAEGCPGRRQGSVSGDPLVLTIRLVFACGESRVASLVIGSWRETNAALLGVFQVTLSCPVRAEQNQCTVRKQRQDCVSAPCSRRGSRGSMCNAE